MRVEHVNPFVESAVNMIQQVLAGTEIKRGKLSAIAPPIRSRGVASMIGVIGELTGRVVIDMTEEVAIRLAGEMNQMEFDSFDDLAHASINELCNWISGHAINSLVALGLNVDIAAPSIFQGKDVEVWDSEKVVLIIPFDTSIGEIVLSVSVRKS